MADENDHYAVAGALWLDLDPRDGVDHLLLSRHGILQITVHVGSFNRVRSDV
jgi:hypothetical protein